MFEYAQRVIVRNEPVEELAPWVWLGDDSSWDFIRNDWVEFHFRDAIVKHCPTRNIVVQAGGNQGMYPRLLGEFFEQVYTFEPHPVNFHILVANCQKDNIIKVNGALSDKCGQFTLIENTPNNAGAPNRKFVAPTGVQYTVQTFTVDGLNLPGLDFLMLDIETYEYHALLGAIHTVNKYHPVIMCEGGSRKVQDLLLSVGYKIVEQVSGDVIYKYS